LQSAVFAYIERRYVTEHKTQLQQWPRHDPSGMSTSSASVSHRWAWGGVFNVLGDSVELQNCVLQVQLNVMSVWCRTF